MTDQELASAIRDAMSDLNTALVKATDAGLRLDVEIIEHHAIQSEYPTPIVSVTASRPILAD